MYVAPWPATIVSLDQHGQPVDPPPQWVVDLTDPDRLPETVPPVAPAAIDGLKVVTPALRPGLL